MGMGTRADDWKALGIMQTGFGLYVAGAIFVFDFYSAKAGVSARYTLAATGKGVGGNLSGFGDPGGWSDIECSGNDTYGQPFSAVRPGQVSGSHRVSRGRQRRGVRVHVHLAGPEVRLQEVSFRRSECQRFRDRGRRLGLLTDRNVVVQARQQQQAGSRMDSLTVRARKDLR